MKLQLCLYVSLFSGWLVSCNSGNGKYDASGTFEVDEVVVSSEVGGQIKELNLQEGSVLAKDSIVGYIDSVPLQLQKAQVVATMNSLREKTADVGPQIKLLQKEIGVLKVQLADAINEKDRTERLIKADAATQKQLDDINTQIGVYEKQIAVDEQQIKVAESTTHTQNSTVMSEYDPLKKSVAQIDDQLQRTNIKNPINGTVLTKYAMAGEFATPGKALYSIGDLSVITLRAYVTGTQLAQLKLNQPVKVFVDSTADTYQEYPGVISWISDKAEFTPKTIQTKDERANLVYAVKIHVKNDGRLKIGMYGEVKFE
ncbi:MAG TPA: HlyD family efflux transporter periplasmic adaptor subunit [Chitinophagaceae bacterium]|nr:HlyD family efflux transporter periplasmic adaptor subunit [Chitinophagaceae bacterium]